jgi:hypothetical protein
MASMRGAVVPSSGGHSSPLAEITMRGLFFLGVAWLALGACGPEPKPVQPPQGPRSTVRIRVFTETSGARLLVPVGKYVFGAPGHGLDRWDLSNQTVLPMDAEAGLPGDRVVAMSADADRGWLWIATDAGVGYYEVGTGVFSQIPPPPAATNLDLAKGTLHLAGALDGGLWVGHDKGLLYASVTGGWVTTPITEPVHAVHVDGAGWLWIATASGVIGRKPSGEVLQYGTKHGCAVEKPRLLVPAPGGGVLVIGEDAKGQQRFALWRLETWTSFRVLPEVKWDVAVPQGDSIIAMGKGRLFRLGPKVAGAVRPLTRDGARVIPLVAKEQTPFVVDIVDAELPTEPLAITGAGDELLVSTRDLGIARYHRRGGAPIGWLRRKEMFDGAQSLSVACRDRDDCWLAMGAKRAWHWLGDHFEPGGPDLVVLAVIRDAAGEIYALHRGSDQNTMQLSRIASGGSEWVDVPGIVLKPPGSQPSVSFARFSPTGQLWVGLLYRDEDVTELTPWGVALVDVAAGKVEYHRAMGPEPKDPPPKKRGRKDKDKKKPKVMPVPVGAVDAAFVDEHEVWFATSEGAARMVDGKISLWSEKDQMPSELLHAVAATTGGLVFVGSNAGIAAFDGETWSYPRNLAFPVADLAVTPDGKVWMATERGIAVYDGKKVRRLDVRRGLVDNELLDLAVDQFARVWARGRGSVVLVMP